MTAVDHAELLSDLGYWETEAGRLSEGQKLASEFSEVEWGHLQRALSQSIALLSEIEGLKACAQEEADTLASAATTAQIVASSWKQRALAAEDILRTQAPDSWRPIETAPKDGETVLIFTPGTFPQVTAASYRDDCAAEHWQAVWHRWHWPADVTHWMPLPAAPALSPQTAESGK